MRWTSKLPTQPGWWWFRATKDFAGGRLVATAIRRPVIVLVAISPGVRGWLDGVSGMLRGESTKADVVAQEFIVRFSCGTYTVKQMAGEWSNEPIPEPQ